MINSIITLNCLINKRLKLLPEINDEHVVRIGYVGSAKSIVKVIVKLIDGNVTY